ncbi:uncharacterized protein [Setaria viridis]|uniref:DUF674 domain-containing protein n=1 Tax=Setaria viridis TaxID=4556 RepID=A0A4U6UCE9_SETVI|nr:uncharacterized protein LOC117859258 [Setaria viridis]TKW13498.1 hypothetical protein SEVIR_5G104800v2 [Setaria viridis]
MATAAALRMKLLIDKKAQRVLFAEASKDVVDFLFSLLAMPIATAVKLLGKESMVGCVGNLYASVDKLESIYVQNGASKDALLCPTVLSSSNSLLRLPEKSLYRCTNTGHANCGLYITARRGSACPTCYSGMTAAAQLLPAAAHGFVLVTYMVKDDLSVTSMSAVSTLLNTFAVRDVGDLQEKTVQLGYNEGLAILKASLQSKTVLTDVFLGDKKAPVLAA